MHPEGTQKYTTGSRRGIIRRLASRRESSSLTLYVIWSAYWDRMQMPHLNAFQATSLTSGGNPIIINSDTSILGSL